VSVVATGIDKAAIEMASQPIRVAPKPVAKPAPAAAPVEARAPVAPAPVHAEVERAVAHDPIADVIRAAEHAPAVRDHAHDEAAFRPKSALFQQPVAEPALRPAPAPVQAAPRMPRVEDFPPVMRAEMEAQSARVADHEERGPKGLLNKLSSMLTPRKEEEAGRAQPAPLREPKLQPVQDARRMTSQDPSLYAPRRGQLDPHGRPTTLARQPDEDQVDIPAFLRRQAN